MLLGTCVARPLIKQTLSLDTKDQAEHTMFYSGKVIAMKDLGKGS